MSNREKNHNIKQHNIGFALRKKQQKINNIKLTKVTKKNPRRPAVESS